jgi:TatD DNase family protein
VGANDIPLPDTLQSVGIHPWYIYNVEEQMKIVREVACWPNVIAIGETGFDKLAQSPLSLQKEVFMLQAILAEEGHKPLIIHCVKAWDELLAVKKKICPHTPWIVHGFRGNGVLAGQLIRHGLYLSFGANFHPKALQSAWPNRLFTETDDAILDIRQVYGQIAASLQISDELFAYQIEKNVREHILKKTS